MTTDVATEVTAKARAAKDASRALGLASTRMKNDALAKYSTLASPTTESRNT